MKITLYSIADDDNVINKNKTMNVEYNISMKKDVNINTPIITLKENHHNLILNSNYCFISELNRFYFIRDLEIKTNNIFILLLECDVIETYKEDILSSVCEYTVQVGNGDFIEFPTLLDTRKEKDYYYSDVDISNQKTTILSTIGGGGVDI